MAIPKTAEKFAKNANSDVPEKKPKREAKPEDMPLLVFRVHRYVDATIREKAKEDCQTFSELCREIFLAGMKAKGIEIRKPDLDKEKKSDVQP